MPTDLLFAGINKRIALDKEDGDHAYFHALSLKLEYVTKLVTCAVLACVGDDVDQHRYSIEHRLVRADSIGDWAHALNDALTGPPAQFILPAARDLLKDLTARVRPSDWRYSAVASIKDAALATEGRS